MRDMLPERPDHVYDEDADNDEESAFGFNDPTLPPEDDEEEDD